MGLKILAVLLLLLNSQYGVHSQDSVVFVPTGHNPQDITSVTIDALTTAAHLQDNEFGLNANGIPDSYFAV